MSKLTEIEAAVDALSLEQKQELLRFLASRVNGADTEKDLTDLTQFARGDPFVGRSAGMATARARRVGMTGLLDTNYLRMADRATR